ncbi:MAG: hypothetical protein L0Y35_06560 [Flammeovirgaceae bacterium]|nr:hypothetical protein [Flammeovirgaceae bacterium]
MRKNILLLILITALPVAGSFAQSVANANVYPSNLEENMYFKGFDSENKVITGINFIVLSDGDDSKMVTPAFTVKLYLYDGQNPIFIKTFEEDGIYHMGKKEYEDVEVSLADLDIVPGTYRLGIYVNADKSFEEDGSDNATLFKGDIKIE